MANNIFTKLTNFICHTEITDVLTGYQAYRSIVLRNLKLKSKKCEIKIELAIKASKKGYKFHEVPVNYYPRSYKEGKKIGWKDGMLCLGVLFKFFKLR